MFPEIQNRIKHRRKLIRSLTARSIINEDNDLSSIGGSVWDSMKQFVNNYMSLTPYQLAHVTGQWYEKLRPIYDTDESQELNAPEGWNDFLNYLFEASQHPEKYEGRYPEQISNALEDYSDELLLINM